MHIFVVGVQANDVDGDADDNTFDLELGATSFSQAPGYHDFQALQTQQEKVTHSFSENHHNKKYQPGRHISVQLFLSFSEYKQPLYIYPVLQHTPAVFPAYRYLYFREINPPPPKSC